MRSAALRIGLFALAGLAALAVALVLAGGVLFALSALHDLRLPPPESLEQRDEGGGSD